MTNYDDGWDKLNQVFAFAQLCILLRVCSCSPHEVKFYYCEFKVKMAVPVSWLFNWWFSCVRREELKRYCIFLIITILQCLLPLDLLYLIWSSLWIIQFHLHVQVYMWLVERDVSMDDDLKRMSLAIKLCNSMQAAVGV